jgi:hypothetical protein
MQILNKTVIETDKTSTTALNNKHTSGKREKREENVFKQTERQHHATREGMTKNEPQSLL